MPCHLYNWRKLQPWPSFCRRNIDGKSKQGWSLQSVKLLWKGGVWHLITNSWLIEGERRVEICSGRLTNPPLKLDEDNNTGALWQLNSKQCFYDQIKTLQKCLLSTDAGEVAKQQNTTIFLWYSCDFNFDHLSSNPREAAGSQLQFPPHRPTRTAPQLLSITLDPTQT